MAKTVKAKINPVVLRWWRDELSLASSFVAEKLGKSSEDLESWETWVDYPTMSQLEKIANVYKTHISVFYLPSPPEKLKPKIDYRWIDMLLDHDARYKLEMNIAEAVQRKTIALDLFSTLDLTIGSLPDANIKMGVDKVAGIIRDFLWEGSHIGGSTFTGKNSYDVLRHWKMCIEAKNVLVSQTSVNTHLSLEVSMVRGFCIAGEWIPMIVLNSKDSPRGKVFTLLHELTHIVIWWKSEVQNIDFRNMDDPKMDPEEIFCNKVAAEILVPQKSFLNLVSDKNFILSIESVSKIARGYGVSEEVIMRRLLDFNKIDKSDYERFRADNSKKWEDKKNDNSKPIVPYYRKVLGANGHLFTYLTLTAYQREKINLLNVWQFLKASLVHLPKIENELYGHSR